MQKGAFIICLFLNLMLGIKSGATNLPHNKSIYKDLLVYHPVHISFTTIEYVDSEKKFKVMFKIFVDDFDMVLKLKYGVDHKLLEGRWEKGYLKTINKYIHEHFKVIVDGKNKTKSSLKFINRDIKENAIWLNYEFNYKPKGEVFNIQNTLMMDLYQDQKNLLIFAFKGVQKGIKFDYKNTKQEIRF